MSQEFSRTENRILGALARLDDFLMNPLLQGHSGTAPETSRNASSVNQGTNEEDSQSYPDPEAGLFHNQMTQNSGPEEGHDMVTGATEQMGNRNDMTGVHDEVAYCSPSTSSGKHKKSRSTSQPHFRSENTRATIEADQILLVLQQLAKNNNSANFQKNINRISKLPKSLATTMPTFDGKSVKFKLFGDLFQTSLIIHNHLTEDDRINYFHPHEGGCATNFSKQ